MALSQIDCNKVSQFGNWWFAQDRKYSATLWKLINVRNCHSNDKCDNSWDLECNFGAKRMIILKWGWGCQIMAIIQVDADRCFPVSNDYSLLLSVPTVQLMSWEQSEFNRKKSVSVSDCLKVQEDNEVNRLLPDALPLASLAPSGSSQCLYIPVSAHPVFAQFSLDHS